MGDASGDGAHLGQWVQAVWGVDVSGVESIDAGMNSRTWRVTGFLPGGAPATWVAKWVPVGQATSLAAGVEAAALAATSGVATGAAEPTPDGRTTVAWTGGALVLMAEVPGEELDDEHADTPVTVGRVLARVHRATAGSSVAGSLPWHWVEPSAAHLTAHPELQRAVAAAVEEVGALGPLVAGVCHGDPSPEAFLRDDATGTVGLIDWTSTVTGPLLYDVASAALYLGGLDEAATMLEAYRAAGGPASVDLDAAATMLRFRWAVQADYFAHRIAVRDLTGLGGADPDAGNRKGLDDARRHLL